MDARESGFFFCWLSKPEILVRNSYASNLAHSLLRKNNIIDSVFAEKFANLANLLCLQCDFIFCLDDLLHITLDILCQSKRGLAKCLSERVRWSKVSMPNKKKR